LPLTGPRFLSLVVGLLLAVHLILVGFFPISSEDTWWHLKQGELYVTSRSLPAQDPFAFTTEGRQWIHYSWAADILFYLVYRAAGLDGLVLFRLCLFLLIAFVLYRILRGCGLHPLASVLLVFVASLALRFRLLIRPEILGFLLLLATLAILLRLQAAPPHAAYLLLAVQVAWINVHGSALFGLALPGLVLVANLLPAKWSEPGWGRLRLDLTRLRHLSATVICLPFVSLLNPQGASMLLFPLRQNRMMRLEWFTEWMPVWRLPEIDPTWWEVVIVFGVVLLVFVAVSTLLLIRERQVDPVGWGVVLSMGTYAVLRNRAIPYFILAILPFLALALVRLADHLQARASGGWSRWLERTGVLACLLVLGASVVDQTVLSSRFQHGFGLRANFFPAGAAAFLERHRLDGRIFNTYEFGGYLIWRRWPLNQVLMDGRYDAILFDEAVLEGYIQAHRSPEALDKITHAYGVQILVLNAKPGRRMASLVGHPAWARLYWDPVAEVYVRRGGPYGDLVAAHEYRLTGPAADTGYLTAYRRDPARWEQALAELRRAVAESPENVMAWLGLAQEYRALGPAAAEKRLEALDRAADLMAGTAAIGRVHAERGESLLQLGRLDEARTAAQTALRQDRSLVLPRIVRATVAERHGAWKEAREELQRILESLGPQHPEASLIRQRLEAVEQRLGREAAQ
jgi:tetratricopeptide (TPR) repeat protein